MKKSIKLIIAIFLSLALANLASCKKHHSENSKEKDKEEIQSIDKGWTISSELINDSITIMNIPLGEKSGKYITALQEQGFDYRGDYDGNSMLNGLCFGNMSHVILLTENGKVYRIVIASENLDDWDSALSKFDEINKDFEKHFGIKLNPEKSYSPPYSPEGKHNYNGLRDGDINIESNYWNNEKEFFEIFVVESDEYDKFRVDVTLNTIEHAPISFLAELMKRMQ